MEVIVYYNIEKPLFKRVVMCPDSFDMKSFFLNMKSVFGEKVIVSYILI